MSASVSSRPVLLVGSVPLTDAEEVFRTASAMLGDHLRRIPDGETGARTNWIGWQIEVFANTPALRVGVTEPYSGLPRFRVREGVDPSDISFGNLGYADAALASWETFARLKEQRVIPAATRFQVSLPTPLAPVAAFAEADAAPMLEQPYEERLLAELDAICAGIPHDQLAIQWDIAVEFGILEGVWQVPFDDPEQAVLERLLRITDRVPLDVELGYHLCYGDAGHKHFKEPQDARRLVAIANALSERVQRPIAWIHLPVPRDRDDDAYFAPLADLKLHPETELYLGLIHLTGGDEGNQRRLVAARRTIQEFGIATECGFGRRPADTVVPLMELHKRAAGGGA
jgi:hypothetical protein